MSRAFAFSRCLVRVRLDISAAALGFCCLHSRLYAATFFLFFSLPFRSILVVFFFIFFAPFPMVFDYALLALIYSAVFFHPLVSAKKLNIFCLPTLCTFFYLSFHLHLDLLLPPGLRDIFLPYSRQALFGQTGTGSSSHWSATLNQHDTQM